MTLKSMTGFSRAAGSHGAWRWAWEIKAVNAKGLDLRVRLPQGFDVIEQDAKARAGQRLSRGTCYATLTAQRDSAAPEVRLNTAALVALQQALAQLPASERLRPASLDGLLAIRPQEAPAIAARVRAIAESEARILQEIERGQLDRAWVDAALQARGVL